MAILSNINDLFRVKSDGAIEFGTSGAGTATYVLTSAGANATPTWTEPTTGTVTSIKLNADSGNAGATAITTSGIFTFTGGDNITTSVSGKTITIDADLSGTVTGSGTENKVVRWTDTAGEIGNGPITFSGNAVTSNSAFAGEVAIRSDQGASNNAVLRLRGQNTTNRITRLQFEDYSGVLADGLIQFRVPTSGVASSAILELGVNSAGLTINHSNNATFVGTINSGNVTAPTFSGDLNGTINTATTAVTQANAIDNTTVATTAYVVNKIAELPAGLNFLGTWNADMDNGGVDNKPNGDPALLSGGGERSTGTTTTKTANKLIDSAATFTTAPAVVVGDRVRVVTPAGPEFALVTAVDSATQLTLAADIVTATGEAYILEVAPFLTEGSYYIVSAENADSTRNATLNGIQDWQVGDWVVASSTNVWQKINNSSVLNGSGTGGSFAGWTGSGTSITLGNAPVTFSGNNSTFAGNITAVRGFFNSDATNVVATFTSTDGIASLQCVDDSGNVEFGASGNNFVVQPAGGVAQLTVGASSSTFAGDISVASGTISVLGGNNMTLAGPANHGGISFATNSILPATAAASNDNTFDLGATAERFKDFYLGGSIISDGSATFAGDVTLGNILLTTAVLPAVNTPSINLRNTNNEVYFQAGSANVFNFMKADYTTMLALDGTSNATFAGNITQNAIGLNTFNGRIFLQNIPDGGNGITMSAVTDKSPQLSFTNANDGFLASILADTARSLVFKTGSGGNNALILDSSQNVGIGTDTPQKKVHIEGTGGASEMQLLISSASDTVGHTAGIGLRGEGGEADGDFRIKGGIFFERIAGSFGNGKMILAVNSSVSNTSVTVADHALTIDTNKYVGIGTVSPGYPLEVNGRIAINSATAPQLLFFESGRAYTEAMRLLRFEDKLSLTYGWNANEEALTVVGTGSTASFVGIGTTSPGTKLDVRGTGNFLGTAASGAALVTIENNSGSTATSYGLLVKGGGNSSSGKSFEVRDDSGNTDLIVKGNGNVGIGTDSPSKKLEVVGDIGVRIDNKIGWIYDSAGDTNLYNYLKTANDGSGQAASHLEISGANWTSGNTASVRFTHVSQTPSLMTLMTGGNVGIATDSPDAKLHVVGTTGLPATSGTAFTGTMRLQVAGGYGTVMDFGAVGPSTGTQWIQVTDASNQAFHYPLLLQPNGGRVAIGSAVASYGVLEIETESALAYSPTVFTNGANIRLKSGGTATTGTTTGVSFGVGGAAELYFGAEQQASTYADAVWQQYSGSAYQTNMRLSAAGTLTVKGDIVAFGNPSDKRLKENIKPIESALDKVSKLQGVTFDWKKSDSELNIKEDIGFIAQDVQKVIPELVRENDDGMLSMRHQGIAPILLEAIKELKAEIEELKSNKCNCNK